MRRAPLAILVLTLTALPAAAEDPTYPVRSFGDWLGSPARDATDPELGRFQLESGLYGAARRVWQRAPDHAGDDPGEILQEVYDGLLHNRPDLPYSHWGDVGHPAYLPDWDHDGAFGDGGGTDPSGIGDADADTDDVADTAWFRIPCYDAGFDVRHRSAGGCDDGDPPTLGIAHEVKIVNARGLVLDGTLWLPPGAAGGACPSPDDPAYGRREAWAGCLSPGNLRGSFPGIVFGNGLSSRQEHYHWFAERMAGEGFVVLTHDPAGQGESEGTWSDLFGATAPPIPACRFAGACRDLQDVARWFVGRTVEPVADGGFRFVARHNPLTDNAPNPALGVLDAGRLALAGNSMGALGTLHYLDRLGAGADLPPVVAAVSLSGAQPTRAIVPIQFQTSDYDGSPALVVPKVLGVTLGSNAEGIGYENVKARYDLLRASEDPGPLSLIVLEGGVHTDHVNQPFITRTTWANALAAEYAADHLNCFVRLDASACAGSVSARAHLSRVYASEFDPDGATGPSSSRCISVPTEASLAQRPDELARAAGGSPVYDCAA